jgi:hypothetical protein
LSRILFQMWGNESDHDVVKVFFCFDATLWSEGPCELTKVWFSGSGECAM